MIIQSLIRKRAVFITLLVIGVSLLVLPCLFFPQALIPYKQQQIISLLIGVVLGISIGCLESYGSRKKPTIRYKPTFFPYLIMWILLCLNILFSNHVRFHLINIFGAYLITLALIFKVYEIKMKQRAITWNELLQEENVL